MYAVAGYMTIYNYYAYPEKVRPRVRYIAQLEPFVSLRMDADLNSNLHSGLIQVLADPLFYLTSIKFNSYTAKC